VSSDVKKFILVRTVSPRFEIPCSVYGTKIHNMWKMALHFEYISLTLTTSASLFTRTESIWETFYMLCLRSEDTFVITCVANLMEVKVLYVQQDLRYEVSSYWRFNV
jgi:hypothetical protein